MILTTDEEIGGFHGAKKIYENIDGKADDLTIAIEPFGDYVVHKHFGVLRFSVEFENPTSHTKTRGFNVNDNFAYFRDADGKSVGELSNLGQNPGYADIKFDVRTVPSANIFEIYQGLEELALSRERVKSCSFIVDGPPLNTSEDNLYVQQLVKEGKKTLVETCSTDAKWAKGHVAISFGPESYNSLHSSNERVNIKSLKKFYDTLIKIF